MYNISLGKVVSLALVDAINPCALAVLTMILIAIIAYNPDRKSNILLTGLAFSASIFAMYMFYGLVIIKSFQVVQVITSVRVWIYQILGVAAIFLGILQIKDYFFYKEGTFGTEMPMRMRPKVKKVIGGITSPKGAFGIGAFVALFLLPCTIGPYIILGGMLSFMEIFKTIPLLVLYNLIFISPMIFITLLVYFGFSKAESIFEWKDKYIRLLHLIAGTIILLFGIFMLFG